MMDNLNFPSASEIKMNLIKQLEEQKMALQKQQEMSNNLQSDANSQVGVDGKPLGEVQ